MPRSRLDFLTLTLTLTLALAFAGQAAAQTENQPRVTPGPEEPDWVAILGGMYGLSMFGDLLNPVETTTAEVPGLFRKVGPGPVVYTPIIALGLVTTNRGGWYTPGEEAGRPAKQPLWSYTFRNTGADLEAGRNLPPPLADGSSVHFDPGEALFGLYVENDGLEDGGAFTEPLVVAAVNQRLAAQPYKAMIYPFKDPETGQMLPNSYLIGWEYSTNDDFQDVVCRLDNVQLIRPAE